MPYIVFPDRSAVAGKGVFGAMARRQMRNTRSGAKETLTIQHNVPRISINS